MEHIDRKHNTSLTLLPPPGRRVHAPPNIYRGGGVGTLEASRAVLAPGPMAGQGVQGVSDERPTDLTEDRPVGLSEPLPAGWREPQLAGLTS